MPAILAHTLTITIDGIKGGQTIIIDNLKVFIVVTCWRALFQHSFGALMFPLCLSHCL